MCEHHDEYSRSRLVLGIEFQRKDAMLRHLSLIIPYKGLIPERFYSDLVVSCGSIRTDTHEVIMKIDLYTSLF